MKDCILILIGDVKMKMMAYDFKTGDFDNWKIDNNYHCLYILEGNKYLYIGESANVKERAKSHKGDISENYCQFHTMYIITDSHANATIMKHYEHLLVVLISMDRKYIVTNEREGYKYNFYYNKNQYELKFDKLWLILEKMGIVKEKKFKDLLDSEEFKRATFKKLNSEQTRALKSIVHVIDSKETYPVDSSYKARPIRITGNPGTGKTALAITLFDYLKSSEQYRDKKIVIVVANPSLREEIKYALSCLKYCKKSVVAPVELTRKKYDIVICDEAHKLRRFKYLRSYARAFKKGNERLGLTSSYDELDWLLMQSKTLILFYDSRQIVSPSAIPKDIFNQKIETIDRGIRPIELKKQMRVQAGQGYVDYIYDILYGENPRRKIFLNYTFRIVESYQELDKIITLKEEKYGLSRIASGYSFEFSNDNTPESHTFIVDSQKVKWNTCTVGWIRKEECKKEIGSIYTLSGIDLNYIGVIIGPELYYDKVSKKIKLDKDKFYDNTVKCQKSDEAIYEEVLNAYAILLTRGIYGTYVYVCDENLREYLKQFIDSNVYSR